MGNVLYFVKDPPVFVRITRPHLVGREEDDDEEEEGGETSPFRDSSLAFSSPFQFHWPQSHHGVDIFPFPSSFYRRRAL